MKNLIKEARERLSEIAKKSKECPQGYYTAIYESENGYTVSHIQTGWETRTPTINFGAVTLSERDVIEFINCEEIELGYSEYMASLQK